ncbi:MAG TPA: hypothetical protein VFV55_10645 [Usitatibacteraceae bacterium]|nr:hypothetical protein [Usitatibacteraceae bacterium]
MSKLEKLDLMGVASLAVVTAALLVGWMVTSYHSAAPQARHAAQEQAVTLTDDGRMRLVVTAARDDAGTPNAAPTRTASVRPAGGPSLEVALPFAFRP